MKLELLWTDQCLFLLVFIAVLLTANGLRKGHVRRSVASIFRKPIAVSAGIVLVFFLLVALVDSVHFAAFQERETRVQPSSLLDRWLAPLDTLYEKTYSAPLALTLYTTETVLLHGHTQQSYPKLVYPAKAFANAQQVRQAIINLSSKALGVGIAVAVALGFVMGLVRSLRAGSLRWKLSPGLLSALLTLGGCISLSLAAFWISRHLHVLGTGKIGQDIFYYAVKSIRTGLVIGLLTTLFMSPLALLLGIAAGYWGGVVDDIIQYVYTTLSSIPGVLLITASVLSMQTYIANHPEQFTTLAHNADARLLALCLILGVTSWTSLCRLLRAEVLKLREIDFVLAARALGSSSFNIMRKHLLPNVMHLVLITLVLDFSFLVLAEAVLSYVGVGVSPMTISWGNMINAARLELAREPVVWWPMVAAFLFMFTLVLACNLFADAVQDAFDPRQSE